MSKRCNAASWLCLLLTVLLLHAKVHCELPQRRRPADSHAVHYHGRTIISFQHFVLFQELQGCMLPAFVFVFILVSSKGPAIQTIKFRTRLWFRFWEQWVPHRATSRSHTLFPLRRPAWEAAASVWDTPSLGVRPFSPKTSSCLLQEDLGRASGELLRKTIVSLWKRTLLGAFILFYYYYFF